MMLAIGRDLLASGCRTGAEFDMAWSTLRQEAVQSCEYSERDMSGPLEMQVIGEKMGVREGLQQRGWRTPGLQS